MGKWNASSSGNVMKITKAQTTPSNIRSIIGVDRCRCTRSHRVNVSEACVYATNRSKMLLTRHSNVPHFNEPTTERMSVRESEADIKPVCRIARAEINAHTTQHCYSCIWIWLGLSPHPCTDTRTACTYIRDVLPCCLMDSVCASVSVCLLHIIRFRCVVFAHVNKAGSIHRIADATGHGTAVLLFFFEWHGLRMQLTTFPLLCRGQCIWVV